MKNLKKRAHSTLENLINDVRRETLQEVKDMLWREIDLRDRLLDNGRSLLETTYGDRFEKLYEQRRKVRNGTFLILSFINNLSKFGE